jgi:hypothetical protein
MQSNMYELSKLILQKVSFDRSLFTKELRKAVRWIRPEEVVSFRNWCLATFGTVYADVISETFETVA